MLLATGVKYAKLRENARVALITLETVLEKYAGALLISAIGIVP